MPAIKSSADLRLSLIHISHTVLNIKELAVNRIHLFPVNLIFYGLIDCLLARLQTELDHKAWRPFCLLSISRRIAIGIVSRQCTSSS